MQEQKASNPALGHLRANLWLLVLSVVISCVLYPGAVWVVGWLFFHNAAEGSLVDKDGKPTTDSSKAVGSSQIAQPFSSAWLFQPRPSAASYNGAASSGSNYAASNPKLRGRVASQLGTISRYTQAHQDAWAAAYQKANPGEKAPSPPSPQDDVTAWFKAQAEAKRDLFTEWANNNSTLAGAWATGTASIQDYILQWAKDHPDVVAAWKKDNKDSPKALGAADPTKQLGAGDLVGYFFSSFEKEHFAKWPTSEAISAWAKDHPAILTRWKAANADKGDPTDDDLTTFFPDDSAKNPGDWPAAKADEWVDVAQKAVVKPDAPQDSDIEQTFFDTWYTEQFKAGSLKPEDFRQVPADMVMASGSGLDPDITLANARLSGR